jgi:SAM-dependent MidA family methyltransferase
MTLADRLRDQIKRDGPITFHDWMQTALYDESDGYYRRARIRQGRAGDYRTAPETSPLFGATLANYFARCHSQLGSPSNWTIFEIGAGRGDFAYSVLTTLRRNFCDVFAATHYLIDEIGDETRNAAARKLSGYSDRLQGRSLAEVAAPFTGIIFSNELLDAFPVHRVIGSQDALRELCVDINDAREFVWTHCDLSAQLRTYCESIALQLDDGQIFEVNLAADDFVARAASLLDRGFLITVDYGAERTELLNDPHRFKGTLRSFLRHRLIGDVLSHPGEQDLTTTVDWTQLKTAGERHGLETETLERLDRFLLNEGLPDQLAMLSAKLEDTVELFNLNAGARELIMPDGLAAHFQVLIQQKIS